MSWSHLLDPVRHSRSIVRKARKRPPPRMKREPWWFMIFRYTAMIINADILAHWQCTCISVTVMVDVDPTPPLAATLHSSSGGQNTCIQSLSSWSWYGCWLNSEKIYKQNINIKFYDFDFHKECRMSPVSISWQVRREQSYWSPCQSTLSMASPENIQHIVHTQRLFCRTCLMLWLCYLGKS